MHILVVNAGSSSLKLSLLDDGDQLVASSDLPRPQPSEMGGVLSEFLDDNPEIGAAGHRVVHGGSSFIEPVLLDDRADAILETLADLAPLHNPQGLAAHQRLAIVEAGIAPDCLLRHGLPRHHAGKSIDVCDTAVLA